MSKSVIDRINYLIALVAEFANAHSMPVDKAYLYLRKYKGIEFADEFYDVNHTMSFDNMVEDLTAYCKKMGGDLA